MFIGVFFDIALLWFFIVLFTRSTNADQSLTETFIVIIGVMLSGFIAWLLIGPAALLIQIIALYFLVDKVCGWDRRTTLKICGWYLGTKLLLGWLFSS